MSPSKAQSELADLQICLASISDLLIPEQDMHVINRDKFSILINYLLQKQADALIVVDNYMAGIDYEYKTELHSTGEKSN